MQRRFVLTGQGQSDIGSVRPTNQDSFLINEANDLFIVADGMGGHAGGEIASSLCISKVCSYIDQHKESIMKKETDPHHDALWRTLLSESINHASAKIYEYSLENPSLRGMGTTATLLTYHNDVIHWGHVGDSRLYLIREGFQYQLTNDHSLVNEQVRAGIITEEEAASHHLKNVITRSVGYQEEEDVDTASFKMENDDLFVLCSDGLYGKVSDSEISSMIQKERFGAIPNLINLANQRGGEDNITVIVIQVEAK